MPELTPERDEVHGILESVRADLSQPQGEGDAALLRTLVLEWRSLGVSARTYRQERDTARAEAAKERDQRQDVVREVRRLEKVLANEREENARLSEAAEYVAAELEQSLGAAPYGRIVARLREALAGTAKPPEEGEEMRENDHE